MRAAQLQSYSKQDTNLQINTLKMPILGDREVLVKIAYAQALTRSII